MRLARDKRPSVLHHQIAAHPGIVGERDDALAAYSVHEDG
jgi:hypothetical protein